MKCMFINIDEKERLNTTLNKIRDSLCNNDTDSVELIVFNVINNSNNKYIDLDRLKRMKDYFNKTLGRKCVFDFNPLTLSNK